MNSDLQTTDCFKFSKLRGTKNDGKTFFPEAMMQGSQETEDEELTKAKRQGREGDSPQT